MLKRRLSILLFLAIYILLFFALRYYAEFCFAPYSNHFYNPLDLGVMWENWEWTYWPNRFFRYENGNSLFAGLNLLVAIRQIFTSHRERDYLSLLLNNLIFFLFLILAFGLSLGLNLLIVPRYLWSTYELSVLPLIGYVLCVKFWLFTQGEILTAGEKTKRKAKNDFGSSAYD